MQLVRYSPLGLALVFVPLYAGPVAAGWIGAPWSTIPVLAVMFLWYVATTRRMTPTSLNEWALFVATGVMQLVLVTIFYMLGRTLAALTGPVALPVWVALALSGGASLIGVMLYRDHSEVSKLASKAIVALEKENFAECPEPEDDITALLDDFETGRIDQQQAENELAAHPDPDLVAKRLLPRTEWEIQYLRMAMRLYSRPEKVGVLKPDEVCDLADDALISGDPMAASEALALCNANSVSVAEPTLTQLCDLTKGGAV